MSVRTSETPRVVAFVSPFWSDETRAASPVWKEFERAVVATRGNLDALMFALWTFDPVLAGHSLRVGASALELAAAAGLTAGHARRVCAAAWVHDLGRLAVPREIAENPGALTASELLVVQEHPAMGAALLTRIPTLRDLCPIIVAVQERWVGDGYPRALRSTAIPLEARILAIADTYDTLTSARAHRPAVPDAAAVAEVLRCAGTQFDPDLVHCWLRVQETAATGIH